MNKIFTDAQIADIVARKAEGWTWRRIATYFERTYGTPKSAEAIRSAYRRNEHLLETAEATGNIKVLKEIARVKRSNSQKAKESRTILQAMNEWDDLKEQLADLVASVKKLRVKTVKLPKTSSSTKMTVEALLSDIHVGKKTESFNLDVCRKRLRHFTEVLIAEIARKAQSYEVEEIILGLLGDNIENANMHGIESMVGCEFTTPEQVRWCIELLFVEVLLPLAQLGVPIQCIGIGGNHDRIDEKKTYNYPTRNGLGWVIYTSLKMLCEQTELTHISWEIPDGAYYCRMIYGSYFLWEHGDFIKGSSRQAFESHLANRSSQLGVILSGIRLGHWHFSTIIGPGRVVINPSVCGQDSYADVNGYASMPAQTINYYVKTAHRTNPYYHSLLVQLGEVS